MTNKISFVMLSSGRFLYFERTMASIHNCQLKRNEFEVILFLNGVGVSMEHRYRELLLEFEITFQIHIIRGIKHVDLLHQALLETRNLEFILLCEDDWLFSTSLTKSHIESMQLLSLENRQICFSNMERLDVIKKGNLSNIYFTLNPSVISRVSRQKMLEKYAWSLDNAILDELEKNLNKVFDTFDGKNFYFYQNECFLVKHIGLFSTRHYLLTLEKFGKIGEFAIATISFNVILGSVYVACVRFIKYILLYNHRLKRFLRGF